MDLAGDGAIEDDPTVLELFFAWDDCGHRHGNGHKIQQSVLPKASVRDKQKKKRA